MTLLLISITDLFSQNTLVILDMQVPGGKTVMINHSGKVVKEFGPSEKVQFDDVIGRITSSLSYFNTYVTYDFSNGPLPVKADSTWTTYDINGKIVKDFGSKYQALSAPSEGIYKAYEEIKAKHREFNIIYIDKDGKELFGGKRFYQGTPSKHNIAFAMERKESKKWFILNTKDGTKKILPISISKPLSSINFESNRYAIGTFQTYFNQVVLDVEGNIVFDPTDVIKEKDVFIIKITDEFIVCKKGDTYYFINKEFKLEKHLENILGVKGLSKKFVFINNGQYADNLFNLDFSKAIIPLKENEVFICTHLTEDILGGIYVDSITRKSIYKIVDAKTLIELGRTEQNIGDIFQDRLIAVDPENSIERKLIAILNTKGEKIYEVDPSSKIYKGIKSTKGVDPTVIKYLELNSGRASESSEGKLSCKFKNLEFIEFYKSSFTELPLAVKNFTKLKNIRLVECDQLNSLPKWLSTLKFLENLDLYSCKNLKKIDLVIPKIKSLKNLNTMNYTISQNFKDQLKISHPKLIINDWFGSRSDDDNIIMESDK